MFSWFFFICFSSRWFSNNYTLKQVLHFLFYNKEEVKVFIECF